MRMLKVAERGRVPKVFGIGIDREIPWEWGPLYLLGGQGDDLRYYLYKRDAVQGKWCVVRICDRKVICTCQTCHGGATVCAELNALFEGKLGVV